MKFDPEQINTFSTLPGVYIMKGRDQAVLYVGKAKNLRQRVRQYFAKGGDGRFIVPFLVSHIEAIETIIVTSEKEALLLENNLIKQHKPKYNALLKDDKSYLAVKVTTRHPWPMIQVMRYKGKPKADGAYFGPYTSAFSARSTVDLLHRMFPLRQCSDQEFLRRTRPCILYDMKKCPAPCVGKISQEEYKQYVEGALKFLRGQTDDILKDLYESRQKASDNLEFERAAEIHRAIESVEKTIETQKVEKPFGVDGDVLAVFRQGDEVVLSQLKIREGKLVGSANHQFSKIADDDSELLQSFILQHYQGLPEIPHEILLPIVLEEAEALSEIISTNQKRTVNIYAPQRGDKLQLIEMARLNAESAFKKDKDEQSIRERTLLEIKEKFGLEHYPKRIECFDNSNLSGDEPVSAMVAFTDGMKDPSRYRKFKLKQTARSDDYGAMQEVLSRRFSKGDLPDLILIDGGKGHLNMALKVLKDLDIASVDVIGIAKEEGRHDRGSTMEQIYTPEAKDPMLLPKHSPVLFLIQNIRDEAHRFAITFQRKRRELKTFRTALDEISGIGPIKQKALLRHFGSVAQVAQAQEADLKKIPSLTKENIKSILDFFNKN